MTFSTPSYFAEIMVVDPTCNKLVEKSGYFVVQIPVVSQMATVLYAGGRSYADAPDINRLCCCWMSG
jgi:hypothetical protein